MMPSMFGGDGLRLGESAGYKEFTNPDDINVKMNSTTVPAINGGNNPGFTTTDASGAGQPYQPQQQLQLQQQPQVIIVQVPRMKRSYEKYNGRAAIVCGVVQVVAGIASIVVGIANAPTCALLGVIGYGIWCGVLFVLSGTFGIVTYRRRTTCSLVAHMVMSIISAVATSVQFGLSVTSATYDLYNFSPPTTGCYYNVGPYNYGDPIGPEGAVATDSLLAIFALVEAVVAIVGSAVTCKVICCSAHFQPVTQGQASYQMTQVPPAAAAGGQLVCYPNNSGAVAYGGGVMPPQYPQRQQQPPLSFATVSTY